jgi:hypothetical protein
MHDAKDMIITDKAELNKSVEVVQETNNGYF